MILKVQLKLAVRLHQASVLDRSDRSVRSNRQTWTGPIGRSKLFLDRSEIGSVQVQSPVGPVRLHLKKCRSYALDRTGPRPNRGCPSLASIASYFCSRLLMLALNFLEGLEDCCMFGAHYRAVLRGL